jgi:hypothetical protein
MDKKLAEQYRFELSNEFATLERVGDYQFQNDPNANYSDDPYGDIYQDAVYGGRVDPDSDQQFFIYEVEWEEESETPGVPDREELGDRLDSVFEGWIVNAEGDRVFALRDREGNR